MTESLTVGYIGLGLMGKSIARNILKAGFPLVVHNRSQGAVQELVAEGARAAFSPAEVASQVEIVFTNLPDTPDVLLVALGPGGIIESARPGLIFIDNSTIKPAAARQIAAALAERGALCLDAPVSGGDIGARNATLTIIAGGQQHLQTYGLAGHRVECERTPVGHRRRSAPCHDIEDADGAKQRPPHHGRVCH